MELDGDTGAPIITEEVEELADKVLPSGSMKTNDIKKKLMAGNGNYQQKIHTRG